jgi:hypothetical protein
MRGSIGKMLANGVLNMSYSTVIPKIQNYFDVFKMQRNTMYTVRTTMDGSRIEAKQKRIQEMQS